MQWGKLERTYALIVISLSFSCLLFTLLAVLLVDLPLIWLIAALPVLLFIMWFAWDTHLHNGGKRG